MNILYFSKHRVDINIHINCVIVFACEQIDSSILQQTLQQSGLLQHTLTADSHTNSATHLLGATGEASVPANVVIQPVSSLHLQTPPPPATVTMNNLTEQDNTGLTLAHILMHSRYGQPDNALTEE